MSFKKIASFIFASAFILSLMSSCSTLDVYHTPGRGIGHGPPAHARAHGYRRKQVAGLELVFDSSLGVYVVIGHPGHYYYDGYFYCLRGDVWEISDHPDRGWRCVSVQSVPMGLRAKGKVKHKKAF